MVPGALGSTAMLGLKRLHKHPYWRHIFSRHKLRGDWITWSFGRCWWLRIGRVILRAEYMRPNAKSEGASGFIAKLPLD